MSFVEVFPATKSEGKEKDQADWRWHVKVEPSGEIVAQGEGYTRERDAWRGFHSAVLAMNEALIDHTAKMKMPEPEPDGEE